MSYRRSRTVLPIFALANAGVPINPGVFVGHGWLMAATSPSLAIGKPLGAFLAAVRADIALKPAEYTCWPGREPSLASASRCRSSSPGRRFQAPLTSRPPRSPLFAASILSAVVGTALLWGPSRQELFEGAAERLVRRHLCGTVNKTSFDDSTYRYDSSSR
jgi:NhaA family Na+:H+ antiporter